MQFTFTLTGYFVHFDTCVFDRVLPVVGRNHSAHVLGCAAPGQVSTLHHDPGLALCLDDGLRAQHSFPVSFERTSTGRKVLYLQFVYNLYVEPGASDYVSLCRNSVLLSSPSTHKMSPLVRKLFLHIMPRILMMRRTKYSLPDYDYHDNLPASAYTNEIDVRYTYIHLYIHKYIYI